MEALLKCFFHPPIMSAWKSHGLIVRRHIWKNEALTPLEALSPKATLLLELIYYNQQIPFSDFLKIVNEQNPKRCLAQLPNLIILPEKGNGFRSFNHILLGPPTKNGRVHLFHKWSSVSLIDPTEEQWSGTEFNVSFISIFKFTLPALV